MFWQHWSKRCPGEQLENSVNSGFLGCSVKNIVNSSVLCAIQNAWNRRSLGVLFQHIFFRRLYRQLYFQNHWKNQRFAAFSLKRMVWEQLENTVNVSFLSCSMQKNIASRSVLLKWLSQKPSLRCSLANCSANFFVVRLLVHARAENEAKIPLLFGAGACVRRWRATRATTNNQQTSNDKQQNNQQPTPTTNNPQSTTTTTTTTTATATPTLTPTATATTTTTPPKPATTTEPTFVSPALPGERQLLD